MIPLTAFLKVFEVNMGPNSIKKNDETSIPMKFLDRILKDLGRPGGRLGEPLEVNSMTFR